jgi:hypothetical protein
MPCVKWLNMRSELVIGFTGLLHTITTTVYTIHYHRHCVFSVCCVLKSHYLVTNPNTVYSSACVFTFLLAGNCHIASHCRNSWPLTPSCIWPQFTIEHSLLIYVLVCQTIGFGSGYIASAQTQQRTPSPTVPPLLQVYLSQQSCDFFFFIWFVRLLALQPLLAYCASLGW